MELKASDCHGLPLTSAMHCSLFQSQIFLFIGLAFSSSSSTVQSQRSSHGNQQAQLPHKLQPVIERLLTSPMQTRQCWKTCEGQPAKDRVWNGMLLCNAEIPKASWQNRQPMSVTDVRAMAARPEPEHVTAPGMQ